MTALPPFTAQQALASVLEWRHAVDVQAIRVLTPGATASGFSGPVTKQADAYLFVIALRNLIRGVRLVRATVDVDRRSIVDAGLAAFDAEITNAVSLRDVLEHFDEYLQGQGRLQRPRPGIPSVSWTESAGPGHFKLSIGVVGQSVLELEIGRAQEAAMRLCDVAVEAVHGG